MYVVLVMLHCTTVAFTHLLDLRGTAIRWHRADANHSIQTHTIICWGLQEDPKFPNDSLHTLTNDVVTNHNLPPVPCPVRLLCLLARFVQTREFLKKSLMFSFRNGQHVICSCCNIQKFRWDWCKVPALRNISRRLPCAFFLFMAPPSAFSSILSPLRLLFIICI
jgi:hypothetical protein